MNKPYPAYRDSGVDWLGQIPSHWEVTCLKLLASINDDALSEQEDPERPIAYVDIGSVDAMDGIIETEEMVFENAPTRARRLVQHGDTIISTVRTYLRAIAPIRNPMPELVVSTGFAVIRPRKLVPEFASWSIKEDGFVERITANSTGVSYPAISATDIGKMPLSVPPIDEQEAIAGFLKEKTGKIDRLIELKNRLLERLAEYRTALITQVVTKGLSIEVTKATGRRPQAGGLYSSEFESSGVEWLGEIPNHWNVQPLRRLLLEPLKYGAGEAAELDDPHLPRYVRITDIDEYGRLKKETFRSLPIAKAAPYLLENNDLLFATAGSIGKTFLYQETFGSSAYASYLVRARLDCEIANPKFVSYYSSTQSFISWLETEAVQSTIKNVSAGRYARMPLPVPPIDEQEAIAEYLDHETSKIDELTSQTKTTIERLKEYRTALITAAVTGKIDVRDFQPSEENEADE